MSRSSRRRLRHQRQRRGPQDPRARWLPRPRRQYPPPVTPRPAWQYVVPILLTAAGVIAILAKAKSIRATLLQFACGITGCSTAGMTTAAWLLITLPLWYAIAGVLLHRVRNKHLRRIYLFGLAPLGALVQLFIPGKGTSWNDIVQGPFDAPVQAGIRWGGLSILLAVLTIGVLGWLVLSEKLRLSLRQSALVVALVSLVPLSVALADASPS